MPVAPGTVVVYTDVACPWSTVALHRFYRARTEAGVSGSLSVDLRLFSLEDVNRAPLPKRLLDAEIPVVGALEPELGWKPWQGDASTWPNSTLLANEAVWAAKQQSPRAAEELDTALRRALFRDSRPIDLVHELVDVAEDCPQVNAQQVAAALTTGSARAEMMQDYHVRRREVQLSPHFFLADGSDLANPGVEFHWVGTPGAGFPVIDEDDPCVYAQLINRATQSVQPLR